MAFSYNPYTGSNGSRSGNGGGGYSPYPRSYGKPATTALTAQQLLAVLNAQKQKHSESFVDRIKNAGSDGLHAVSWTFDKLLRPEYAIATAIDKGVGKGGSLSGALHGAVQGFKGKGDHGFGEVLSHHGLLSGHGRLRGLAGLGLDIAADPLSYVSGGAGGFLAHSAEHEALIRAGRVAISSQKVDKASHAGMELARDQLAHGGEKYAARHALAMHQAEYMGKVLKNKKIPDMEKGKLATLREAAHAEELAMEHKLPAYSMGVGAKRMQVTPTHVLGHRMVPALPKLDNFIKSGAPGAKLAKSLSGKFVRSPNETAITHSLGMSHRRLTEEYTDAMIKKISGHFKGFHLSEAEMLDALHHMESAKNAVIKTKNGAYHLNINHLQQLRRAGKISDVQEKFIRSWHKATQDLYKRDKEFGVKYTHLGERGQMYVPHRLMDKMGHPLSDVQINSLTKAGFQHSRATANFSVKMLKELSASGKLGRDVETNPFNLMVHTIRSRATKQADMTLLHSVAPTMGISTRLVDEAKLARNLGGQAKLTTKIAATQAKHDEAMSSAYTKGQLYMAEHEMAHHAKFNELDSQLRSHKFGRNKPLKAANIARISKRMEKLQANHALETQAIADGTHKPLNDIVAEDVKTAAAHMHDINNMNRELKSLGERENRIRVGKGNRAYSTATMKTVAGAVDKHGHPIAFDPAVAHAIEHYHKIVSGDDKAIQDFSKGWAKWTANWKLLVTSVNPGYRIRNTMSDVWSMYISGMPMSQVSHYAVTTRKMMQAAKKGDPNAVERIREAYHHGILSGLFQGDVQQVGKIIARQGKTKAGLVRDKHYLQAAGKLSQDVNANVENWGRLTHYMWLRDTKHMSAVDAAFRVKRAHFDYEDLTPFEQRVMKQVAPFYTWTRKNIPFQIKALAERPGKVLAFPKTAIESEQASGGDKGNIIPNFVTNGMGFQIPFGKHNYYLPQIGVADLQALDSKSGLIGRATGLLNPALKTPMELAMNKSMFTGQPIKGDHPRNPVSPLGAALLSLIPGSNVGETGRLGADGKELHGPGANPYYTYLLGQIPGLNTAGVRAGGIKGAGGGTARSLLSELAGQSVQHVDPKLQQMIASINAQNQVKQEVKGLRDEGLYPAAKNKKSRKQRRLDAGLYSSLGRR